MAKSLSQITFDFFAEPEEKKQEDVPQQNTSKNADKYSVPKPPQIAEAPESVAEPVSEPISEFVPEPVAETVPEPIVENVQEEKTEQEEEVIIEKTLKTSNRGRRSLKNTAFDEEKVNIPDDEVLFQKQYYAIGEVANMFGVNASLLRYWETEFDILQPRKNKKGDRFFRPQDIKNFYLIFDLLRRRKFTIEGAKDYLKKNKKVDEQYDLILSLEKIKSFLLELKTQL